MRTLLLILVLNFVSGILILLNAFGVLSWPWVLVTAPFLVEGVVLLLALAIGIGNSLVNSLFIKLRK